MQSFTKYEDDKRIFYILGNSSKGEILPTNWGEVVDDNFKLEKADSDKAIFTHKASKRRG